MGDRSRIGDALAELDSLDWTTRAAALRALGAALDAGDEPDEEMRRDLAALVGDPKWEVRRELALLLAKVELDEELASPLLDMLATDHTRWVRETAQRSQRARSTAARKSRARELTPATPEPHLAYVAERVAELGSRSLSPHVVLDLVAQGGEYFYRALAADTAHEVRTLLTPIVGYFEKLVTHLEQTERLDDKAGAYTRTIKLRLDQLRVLIDQITIYAGSAQTEFRSSDVCELAREAVQIAAEKCASDAKITWALPDELLAEISAARLRQAIINLVTNALEAMPRGGTLAIAGSNGAGAVRLTIEDTGCGMTAEQVESAFLRFRTTKRATGGTGLGLPIAKRIIEDEHRGTLIIQSSAGAGTKVELTIPIARGEPPHGAR